MPDKPAITDFSPGAIVAPNTSGLDSSNGSQTEVIILGNNMAQGLAVLAKATDTLKWTGTMGAYDTTQQGWPAILTCSNTTTGMGDTMDIAVTVGTAPNASDTVTFPGINVAPVSTVGKK